jgi:hypothetical protein
VPVLHTERVAGCRQCNQLTACSKRSDLFRAAALLAKDYDPTRGPQGQPRATNWRKGKGHPGAARALYPNSTRHYDVAATRCPHCRTEVLDVVQVAVQSYDRIELPEIRPDGTRLTLAVVSVPAARVRALYALYAGDLVRASGAADFRSSWAADQ